ncbi:hypothetical protein [Microbacterium sp. 22296]|uniref:hypothetical protein n=1 Tax=Microbacterium sp. 22296 TaxID=3453903 RepID=UPI003F82AB1F
MSQLTIEGLSRLQQLELEEQFGDEVRVVKEAQAGLHSIEVGIGLIVVVLGYPLVRAIGGMVSRDRVKLKYRIERTDGSTEEGSIEWDVASSATQATGAELGKLIKEIEQQSEPG